MRDSQDNERSSSSKSSTEGNTPGNASTYNKLQDLVDSQSHLLSTSTDAATSAFSKASVLVTAVANDARTCIGENWEGWKNQDPQRLQTSMKRGMLGPDWRAMSERGDPWGN